MERKSDTVRRLVAAGDFKAALRIAKDFRLGITKTDSDDMRRGYECMVTCPEFYKSIGFDVEECVKKGIEVLVRIYG
ncbi:hypothetical protein [Anaerotruncus colihominis]|uniref:hypothetical protein n=1 Tax=Anaerotruncus colihominis TaxID=169435 RepID=UPI00242B0D0A|nr:hypothetical protein [Anaerotruncus colihominis]